MYKCDYNFCFPKYRNKPILYNFRGLERDNWHYHNVQSKNGGLLMFAEARVLLARVPYKQSTSTVMCYSSRGRPRRIYHGQTEGDAYHQAHNLLVLSLHNHKKICPAMLYSFFLISKALHQSLLCTCTNEYDILLLFVLTTDRYYRTDPLHRTRESL